MLVALVSTPVSQVNLGLFFQIQTLEISPKQCLVYAKALRFRFSSDLLEFPQFTTQSNTNAGTLVSHSWLHLVCVLAHLHSQHRYKDTEIHNDTNTHPYKKGKKCTNKTLDTLVTQLATLGLCAGSFYARWIYVIIF